MPPTGVGGMGSGWIAAAPELFRRMPVKMRPEITRRCIAPKGSDWLRPRLAGVPMDTGRAVAEATPIRDRGPHRSRRRHRSRSRPRPPRDGLRGGRHPVPVPIAGAGWGPRRGRRLPGDAPGLRVERPGAALRRRRRHAQLRPVMRFVVGTWYAAPALARNILGRRQRMVRLSYKPASPFGRPLISRDGTEGHPPLGTSRPGRQGNLMARNASSKYDWPDDQKLQALLDQHGTVETARQVGCPPSSLSRRIRKRGLQGPKQRRKPDAANGNGTQEAANSNGRPEAAESNREQSAVDSNGDRGEESAGPATPDEEPRSRIWERLVARPSKDPAREPNTNREPVQEPKQGEAVRESKLSKEPDESRSRMRESFEYLGGADHLRGSPRTLPRSAPRSGTTTPFPRSSRLSPRMRLLFCGVSLRPSGGFWPSWASPPSPGSRLSSR